MGGWGGGVASRVVSDGLEVGQKSLLCILSVYVYWYFRRSEAQIRWQITAISIVKCLVWKSAPFICGSFWSSFQLPLSHCDRRSCCELHCVPESLSCCLALYPALLNRLICGPSTQVAGLVDVVSQEMANYRVIRLRCAVELLASLLTSRSSRSKSPSPLSFICVDVWCARSSPCLCVCVFACQFEGGGYLDSWPVFNKLRL